MRSRCLVHIALMTEDLHVFVYGTLKPGAANFDRYCGSRVLNSHRAYIDGDLYDLPSCGYPAAIHGSHHVYGFVLLFRDDRILLELDELEDYDPQRRSVENDYNRELVTTYSLAGNSSGSAWVYLMSAERVRRLGGIFRPDGWW
jgi:gamma-glutamylcyclotransferase (GGCT)/AIG2-like uncharacterized protein YtfP